MCKDLKRHCVTKKDALIDVGLKHSQHVPHDQPFCMALCPIGMLGLSQCNSLEHVFPESNLVLNTVIRMHAQEEHLLCKSVVCNFFQFHMKSGHVRHSERNMMGCQVHEDPCKGEFCNDHAIILQENKQTKNVATMHTTKLVSGMNSFVHVPNTLQLHSTTQIQPQQTKTQEQPASSSGKATPSVQSKLLLPKTVPCVQMGESQFSNNQDPIHNFSSSLMTQSAMRADTDHIFRAM